eukprot:6457067-Amphidinium_carterae.1
MLMDGSKRKTSLKKEQSETDLLRCVCVYPSLTCLTGFLAVGCSVLGFVLEVMILLSVWLYGLGIGQGFSAKVTTRPHSAPPEDL